MSGAFGAFAYLTTHSLRNQAVAQARRLRSPRYVIFVAVACAYFFALLHRPTDGTIDVPAVIPTGRAGGGLELLTIGALAVFIAKWWLIGSGDSALAFAPAEMQFLFPAPISRRALVLYKIGRTQLKLLIGAVVITVLARRANAPLPPILRIISVWVLFCTLTLHQMAAALVRTGAAQRGRGLRRNAIPIVIVTGAFLILFVAVARAWPGARGLQDLPRALTRVAGGLRAPLPHAVLAPLYLVSAPSYAQTVADWLPAIGIALLVLALHVVWVVRADTVFEDAAVEASARLAEHLAARRVGAVVPTVSVVQKVSGSLAAVRLDRPPPPAVRLRRALLPLAPVGDPAVAILWKNTLALLRGTRLRTVVMVGIVLAAVAVSFRELGLLGDASGGGWVLLGALTFVASLILIILGPTAIRNDLRQDLLHIDLLRTYPLPGSSLVFAELASSTLALTLVQWGLLAVSYACLASAPPDLGGGPVSLFQTAIPGRLTMLAVAIAVLPVVNGSSFLVQNAAALLFPDWVRLGATTMGGMEVIGQRLLGLGASFIALAILLAPPIFVGFVVLAIWQGDAVPTQTSFFLAVLLGVATGAAEIYLAVNWLGRRLERTDGIR